MESNGVLRVILVEIIEKSTKNQWENNDEGYRMSRSSERLYTNDRSIVYVYFRYVYIIYTPTIVLVFLVVIATLWPFYPFSLP